MNRFFNYFLIGLGGLVALYANAYESQNTYILIGGVVILMTGLYRLSRGISNKANSSEHEKNQHSN
ncbi:hypothetical protein N9W96_01245 [Flavobacteriaceae bacterium]|nr:hypothetical protein [Flavobacteriaceae bacterium]MDC3242150.1 hypothetical protein [Flavobacteriaceae bacterium]